MSHDLLTKVTQATLEQHRALSPECYRGFSGVARLTENILERACSVAFGSVAGDVRDQNHELVAEKVRQALEPYPGLIFAIPAVTAGLKEVMFPELVQN